MASSRYVSAILGPKKLRFPGPNLLALAQVMDLHVQKHYEPFLTHSRSAYSGGHGGPPERAEVLYNPF
jgi:hypothetical protein